MDYTRHDAQAYAKAHFTGVWAATLTPFGADGCVDEAGFEANIQHWTRALKIAGLFVSGKQGEFFSMSVAERKRSFEIAVAGGRGQARTVMSCSDTNLDTSSTWRAMPPRSVPTGSSCTARCCTSARTPGAAAAAAVDRGRAGRGGRAVCAQWPAACLSAEMKPPRSLRSLPPEGALSTFGPAGRY